MPKKSPVLVSKTGHLAYLAVFYYFIVPSNGCIDNGIVVLSNGNSSPIVFTSHKVYIFKYIATGERSLPNAYYTFRDDNAFEVTAICKSVFAYLGYCA